RGGETAFSAIAAGVASRHCENHRQHHEVEGTGKQHHRDSADRWCWRGARLRRHRVDRAYLRPAALRPFSSAAKDWLGAGISQRKPFSTSCSTLFESTCGWPHGTPASLQIASASSIAAATSGCSYCRG